MKKILIISEDFWHPTKVIADGLKKLEDEFSFTYSLAADDFENYDVVAICKGDRTSKEDETKFMTDSYMTKLENWLSNGGSLLLLHAGTLTARNPRLADIMGGISAGHPSPAECVLTYRASQDGHPISEGMEDLTINDECYFMELTKDDITVFARNISHWGDFAAGFTRPYGKGRVCAFTPGHCVPVWESPVMTEYMRRIFRWCAGEAVK